MDCDEDKAGLKLNALELAEVDLIAGGFPITKENIRTQQEESRERHREGGKPRCGRIGEKAQ